MSRRYEIFLAGPIRDESSLAALLPSLKPIPIEEMLARLVLALKGSGYEVRSSAYEIVLVADPPHAPFKQRWTVVEDPIGPGLGALTPRQREVIAEEIERRNRVSHPASTVEVAAADSTEPQGETHE